MKKEAEFPCKAIKLLFRNTQFRDRKLINTLCSFYLPPAFKLYDNGNKNWMEVDQHTTLKFVTVMDNLDTENSELKYLTLISTTKFEFFLVYCRQWARRLLMQG